MGKMLWSTLDTVAFQPAKERVFMQNFMNGRNGVDDLSAALGGIGVVLALLGTIFTWRIASYIALAILLVALFRAFSKNLAARERENDWFHSVMAKLPGGGSLRATARQTRARGAAGRAPRRGRRRPISSARPARPRRCGRSARRRRSSSAPTAAPCSPSRAARARSSSPAPNATPHGDKVVTARQAAAQRHPSPAWQSRDPVEIDAHPVWPLG